MSTTLAAYLDRLSPADVRSAAATIASDAGAEVPRGLVRELRAAGVLGRVVALVIAYLLQTTMLVVSWACVGQGALSGRLDYGWLGAWALALGSTIPLRAACTWLEGTVSVIFGLLVKRRLLQGALSLPPEQVRIQGLGAMLSKVLESESIDDLGASGAIGALLAAVQLLVAPALLRWGAAPGLETLVIGVWALLCVFAVVYAGRRRRDWTRERISLTNHLVENMAAHRTRLAQQPPVEWHTADDASLAMYQRAGRRLDAADAWLESALPRSYVIVACLALVPAFVSGSTTLLQLAVTFGTILFLADALTNLTFGGSRLAAGWVAWDVIRPVLDAAAPSGAQGPEFASEQSDPSGLGGVSPPAQILLARQLRFAHPGRDLPVLRGVNLTIRRGEQIVLEGGSGSGKSTLASILAGARAPTGGFVLAGGLDRRTLGDRAWRQRIALAPQYHENHIFTGSLLFNLLLGRPYPFPAEDLAEAATVCAELGLQPLIDRMPAGLNQFVGETGWRLSQGERSRIFLARALLSRAELVMLDESLAALDPENLRQCLECVIRRAPTLVLIAHP
jgi:ATP-binding cassette, subfamily B, bacterial